MLAERLSPSAELMDQLFWGEFLDNTDRITLDLFVDFMEAAGYDTDEICLCDDCQKPFLSDEFPPLCPDCISYTDWLSLEHAQAYLVHQAGDTEFGVYNVKVDPDHRGQGHGRRLMESVIARGNEHKFDLYLYVYGDNTPAIRLYESVGFVVTGTDHGHSPKVHTMRRPFI